jgi:hypothetical protein
LLVTSLRALAAEYRQALWELAQFEHRAAWLRGAFAAVMLFAVAALPFVVLVAGIYGAHTRGEQLALGALLIAATAAAGYLWRRRVWERPVLGRVAGWHERDPRDGEIGVAIANADVQRACVALMRAQLYPPYCRRGGTIPDAPTLDYYLAVALPSRMPHEPFEVVAERTREVLRSANIRARVVGIDVP